jgi:signal transduction histidine kinase/DNA-binding response OmpR family regulator
MQPGGLASDSSISEQSTFADPFLVDGGETGALIRSMDWATTPIGPISGWSQSLRMMVNFLLANRFPLLLWWGPEYVSIYNDAYRPILGTKHPRAMGLPVSECWSEIWHILQPLIDTPFNGGPATWMEDIGLEINRHGFVEETHFTIAYSPVPDETAPRGIGGVLATVHEITEKVLAERRVVILRDLGARAADAKTAEEACRAAAAVIANHGKDLPFALLYLVDQDGKRARLAAAAGVAEGEALSPLTVPLDGDTAWPLGEAIRREETIVVEQLGQCFNSVPGGPWSDPPHSAVVVPLRATKAHEVAALLVAGVSPRLRLDHLYRSFFDLVAAQIATSIANARAYEEERKRAEALAEIDRAKTAFFSNVSHEFRTPLTLMLGPIEDALNDGTHSLPERHQKRLDLAHRNSLRLLKLVNSLLDFARIEAGRIDANFEPTDLSKLTAGLASNFETATQKAGLELVIKCERLSRPVFVDRNMWEKIVLNLISNAFKFTFSGRIAVELKEDRDRAQLFVRDTGMGIPQHELPRLFERFHRVAGQKSRSFEGSGIGLALIHELVKLHGGSIEVESEVDRGTTFKVSVPLGSSHLPQERIQSAHELPSTALRAQAYVEEALRWLPDTAEEALSDRGEDIEPLLMSLPSNVRVLIADDNADMRDYLKHLLATHWDVEAVADGRAALAAIRVNKPDLVLTDVMMPIMDGFGLLREIRADPQLRELPVVMLSARAGEEARVEGLQAAANDYLTKPFSARELIARLSANLELARVRQESQKAIRDEAALLEQLNQVGNAVAAEVDLERAVQVVTDAATKLSGAAFGAFFYNVAGDDSESYTLYTLSGAPREAFAEFPQPRNTDVFSPTFRGEAIVRSADITKDPRYGKNAPYYGHPPGHLPVRSYLAVPVVSHSGEVLGGLFLGHPEPGVFDRRAERLVAGIAIQAAIAIDKAHLFRAAQQEIAERRRVEAALRESEQSLEGKVAARTAELLAANDRLRMEALERERVEAQLRQAQKMEAIGHLTGGVAHDFNNLLTVVIGNIGSLQRNLGEHASPRAQRWLDSAMHGARRAASLTQHLLAFSRRQPLDPKPTDLNELLTSLSEILVRTLGERIQVRTVPGAGLWHAEVDQNQLEAAILNLAVNARDAMPNGGRLTIETANAHIDESYAASASEVTPGQYVVVAVSDTGNGMSQDVLERAFEPFFTTKPTGQGTGLGLSQVYGFVKQSGGHVRLYSEKGQGTTVKIYLPRTLGQTVAIESEISVVPDGRHEETVLVVEDNANVREYSAEILRELGYTVIEAEDGPAALRQLDRNERVSLIFTDIGLPGMNGRELAQEARRRRPEIRVLYTTGYARDVVVHHGRLDPGVQLIAKPFTYVDLAAKVREALANRE